MAPRAPSSILTALLVLAAPLAARAEPPSPAGAQAARSDYALPMLMRPAAAPTLIRVDMAVVHQESASGLFPVITGAYRFRPDTSLFGRVAIAQNEPDKGASGTALSNPLLAAQYVPTLAPGLKMALFGGVTLPVGAGGGNSPDRASRAAVGAGIYGRQAMDNALFAVNYMTPTVGVGVALVKNGVTLQGDLTVLQLMRVRGDEEDKDSSRTNFTAGALIGYRVAAPITLGAEAHYQRWLSTPAAVEKNGNLRQPGTVGGFVRLNLPADNGMLFRPAVGYFVGVDSPMSDTKYRIIQLDLPMLF